ncbi:MAG: hypothetical protein ACRD4A_11675 [Candidatus Acidiferrales bacterium]
MNTLFQDIRYAIRVLMKAPGFTTIAVLTLALGIGANTALFSVVNGVLLNPLPYPRPNEVVSVASEAPGFGQASISYPNFLDWARDNRTFSSLAAYRQTSFNPAGQGEPERVPLTFAAVVIVLLAVALLACHIPARRAMRSILSLPSDMNRINGIDL